MTAAQALRAAGWRRSPFGGRWLHPDHRVWYRLRTAIRIQQVRDDIVAGRGLMGTKAKGDAA